MSVLYSCQTFNMSETHFYTCPSFFFKKIMEDIVRTQKQKKLNTILQKKESIYTLNSISTFKN